MAKGKKLLKIFCGVLVGFSFSLLFLSSRPSPVEKMCVRTRKLTNLHENRRNSSAETNLLYVGVMTAPQYLDTRAKAVHETWGTDVPGKITFYSSETSRSNSLPLVALEGVDDSYPPQKKSFMMLKHMYDYYIDKYEWFMRADDDVYVRTDRLEELLRSVDSRKPWFIGQTGRGKSDELGLLSLESDENFCMGGPGIIFSRGVLERMAPYVEECLQHLYTTHEDVEIGRCIRRFAGISCTWSYEMQVIFYHNQSGQSAFTGELKQKEVHRAITLHPIKQAQHMYRLHKYVKGLKIQNQLHASMNLHRDIAMSMAELGVPKNNLENIDLVDRMRLFPERKGSDGYLGDTNFLGIPAIINKYSPSKLEDVLEWELITKNLFSHRDLNPKKRIGSSIKEGLIDIIREVMEITNSFSKQRGRVIDFKEVLYCYWRLDPLHGVDLVLDLLLVYKKYRGHRMTIEVRRHAYVQQAFADIYIREMESKSMAVVTSPKTEIIDVHQQLVSKLLSIKENLQPYFHFGETPEKTLNFILPISGRYEIFKRFLKLYEEVCLMGDKQNTHLFIILYKSDRTPKDFGKISSLVTTVQNKFGFNKLTVIPNDDEFTRGKALQQGVNMLEENDLMLFIDVDIVFDGSVLTRIRKNTVQNQSLYFPIVYSLYNPKLLNKSYRIQEYSAFNRELINSENGYWRQFGFGIVSLFKSDYIRLGGFNLSISGWGYEDVTFYDNVIKSKLKIVRSVDPSLLHVYHSIQCDNLNYTQKSMCLGTEASTLGSLSQLQKYYYKYKYLFR